MLGDGRLVYECLSRGFTASMRLCMGSRRGFIIRMKLGQMPVDPMTATHTVRIRQRNTLGPSTDGHQYAVVHVTGYVKNWPPASAESKQRTGMSTRLQ